MPLTGTVVYMETVGYHNYISHKYMCSNFELKNQHVYAMDSCILPSPKVENERDLLKDIPFI